MANNVLPITPSDDGKYIIINVVGDMTGQSAIQQNLEAHSLGFKLGISRYLVDVTESKNTSSISENYKFAHSDMPNAEISRTACVAILADPKDHSHDFIETLSRNAGFNTTIFRNRELAVQHLLKGL